MSLYMTDFSERTFWRCERFIKDYDAADPQDRVRVALREANLVSSLLENGLHAPALDLDRPSTLVDGLLCVRLDSEEAGIVLRLPPEEIENAIEGLVDVGFARTVDLTRSNGNLVVCTQLAVPAQLVPSTTAGHSHLYAEMELCFEEYFYAVLAGMQILCLLESGFVHLARVREMTCLRKPEVFGQLQLAV